ncbi:hypothetical protein B7463_g9839, partial [Scytalidium lignicola]
MATPFHPPPPPPPPNVRPPGGQPAFFPIQHGARQGPPGPPPPPPPPPGHQGHQGPPPGFPMQMPMRQVTNSTRIMDITPPTRLTEKECRKKLTTYDAYTIRKVPSSDPKEKATWMRVELVKEPLSHDVIASRVKKLDEQKEKEKYRDIAEKKASLYPNQQGQITRLLDELMSNERDQNFEWSLAQLERKEGVLKEKGRKDKRETKSITLYVKRSLIPGANATAIYHFLEKVKADRLAAMTRPPQPPPPPPPQPVPVQVPPQPIRGEQSKPKKHRSKNYHSDASSRSSSSSRSDSDFDSGSEYSSGTYATSISSRSDRHSKKYNKAGRSRSRHREHHKLYYPTSQRINSPEPPSRREVLPLSIGTQPRYVPDAPLVQSPIPVVDPFNVRYQTGIEAERAYHAGRQDAEAERAAYEAGRLEVERAERAERVERAAMAERYARPPPRQIVIEPPRAMVSYVRPPERYSEPRFPEADARYPSGRYVEDLRREDRQRRRADERIDRGPRIVVRPIFDDHPFAPRAPRSPQSNPSSSRSSSGW